MVDSTTLKSLITGIANSYNSGDYQSVVNDLNAKGPSLAEIVFGMDTVITLADVQATVPAPPPPPAPVPAALTIVTQPESSVSSSIVLTPSTVVQLVDNSGNFLMQSGIAVVASIVSSTVVLSGTTTSTTDASGQATFSNLILTGAGSQSITFSSDSLVGTSSSPVSVVVPVIPPAPVASVIVTLASTSVTSGLTTNATVVTKDASGNILTGRSIVLTSSTPSVATISDTGVIAGISVGTTIISATSEGQTGSATLTITAIPVSTVTVSISSSSVVAGTTAQATATTKDSNSNVLTGRVVAWASSNTSVAAVSNTGLITSVAAGTASITATSEGKAGSASLTVTAVVVVTPPPVTGTFAAPDLIKNESFETGFGAFTSWDGSSTPTVVTRDSSVVYDGKWSVKRSWVPNPGSDTGAQMICSTGSHDRLWVRFYMKLTQPINTIMKFCRFYDPRFSTNLGGFFLANDSGGLSGNGIMNVGTDQENQAIVTTCGVKQAQLIDGNWHSFEIDYWRNGDPSGFPSFAFWFDGNPQAMPDGTAVKYQGAGNSSFWKGGRLNSGVRASTVKLGYIEWLATLNAGNTTTGQCNLDYIAISSIGRIGP